MAAIRKMIKGIIAFILVTALINMWLTLYFTVLHGKPLTGTQFEDSSLTKTLEFEEAVPKSVTESATIASHLTPNQSIRHPQATEWNELRPQQQNRSNSLGSETAKRLYTSTVESSVTGATSGKIDNTSTEHERVGYVMSVSFWDQQTYSVGNILSLQCWSAHANMATVVEPFMIDSKFGAPITSEGRTRNRSTVPMSLLYDLGHWNDYSKRMKYSSLVTWEHFLRSAPRDTILVELRPIHRKRCSLEAFRNEYSDSLAPHGFRFVKEICFENTIGGYRNRLSMGNFTRLILGGRLPHEVTVIFTEWSGTTVPGVVDLDKCMSYHTNFNVIAPSRAVLADADAYIDRYLGGSGFNAVMLRVEWMVMNINQNSIRHMVNSCFERTLKRLHAFQNQSGLNATFVAIDVGKYGSKTNARLALDIVVNPVNYFLRTVYGNSTSLEEWERTFEGQSDAVSPGYVGFLQKVIATRARCLLLTGQGSFQKHALSMYTALHRPKGKVCYAITDSKCQVRSSEGITFDIS